ncbi:BTB/POZ domain-containing protein 2-like [Sitodiplosis mosellana]|uniref:BTB/POZ domain-containing protein 2-like n=1 Tax=Sitodiplosis mosellana TaxID=263140 RepID=UPI00244502CE|nr:BTB/POZ domain-containing protein 2-like [Sitodiplosis mosellana]
MKCKNDSIAHSFEKLYLNSDLSDLTFDNFVDVINLCERFELKECVNTCEVTIQSAITNDTICQGYKLALILNLDSFKQFCAKKIKENAAEVLKSDSFLNSDQKLLDKILKLIPFSCDASVIVNACMEWSKAACARNRLEINSENLRTQFGDSFNRIPFDELTVEEFSQQLITYKRFFVTEELEQFIKKIAINPKQHISALRPQPTMENGNDVIKNQLLECKRLTDTNFLNVWKRFNTFTDIFYTNKPLLLTEIHFAKLPYTDKVLQFNYILRCPTTDQWLASGNVDQSNGHAVIEHPVVIEAHKRYETILYTKNNTEFSLNIRALDDKIRLDDDIEINFQPTDCVAVTKLVFQRP